MSTVTLSASAILVVLLACSGNCLPSIKAIKDQYSAFVIKYGRVHKSESEANRRFGLFMQSVYRIEEQNKRNDGATYGVNRFADWTDQEKSQLLMKPSKELEDLKKTEPLTVEKVELPTEFDWKTKGKVTSIKNQGKCGSCYAFGVMAQIESLYAIKTGLMVDLSEQQLVDCTPDGDGCDGADPGNSLMFLRQRGALTEAEYPYKGKDGNPCPAKAGKIFVNQIYNLGQNQKDLATYLYSTSPFTKHFWTPPSFMDYKSGVYTPTKEECDSVRERSGHVVEVIGFGVENNQKYWLLKNSWTEDFGLDGYFKMASENNPCDVVNYAATIL